MKAIYEFLENSAKSYPKKDALILGSESISYFELLEKTNALSHHLQNIIKVGDIVSLLSENSINFIISYFGIMKAGGIVHIAPSQTADKQLNYQFKKTKTKLILCSKKMKNKAIRTKNEGSLIVEIDTPEFLKEIDPNLYKNRFNEISSIVFTSGTTGIPKGVIIKHKNVIIATENIVNIVQITKDDIEINPLQLSHSFGLGCIHAIFSQGATSIIFQNMINLKEILKIALNKKATGFVSVPSTFRQILDNYKNEFKLCDKHIRYLLTNSGAIPKNTVLEILDQMNNVKFFTYYGLTEASRSTFLLFNDNIREIESVGKVAKGVKIKIVDENEKQVKNNQQGEIWIKGKNVIEKYLDKSDTQKRIRDMWLRTGDIGHFDSGDFLYVDGRKDDMINVSGEKVSPLEIENTIREIDSVKDVAVIGISDVIFGEVPIAFIVTKSNLEEDEIIKYCIPNLERFKIPQKIFFVNNIPRNDSGKIERKTLKLKLDKVD